MTDEFTRAHCSTRAGIVAGMRYRKDCLTNLPLVAARSDITCRTSALTQIAVNGTRDRWKVPEEKLARRVDWATSNISMRVTVNVIYLPYRYLIAHIMWRVWQEMGKKRKRSCRRTSLTKTHVHRIYNTFIRFLTSVRLHVIERFCNCVRRTSSTRPHTRLSVPQLDGSALPTVFQRLRPSTRMLIFAIFHLSGSP